MIRLTRLDGEELHVSVYQIETVTAMPHTRVTLASGRQLHVRETVDDLRAAMLAWFRALPGGPGAA